MVRLNLTEEKMMVHAFRKGIVPGPFSESLIWNHPKTFTEKKRRAVAHITTEEHSEKRTCVVPTQPCAAGRPQTLSSRGYDRDEGPREAATLSKA